MPQSAERMPCANCDYTSDPGSLLCALCGSPLRRTPTDRRRTAPAFTSLTGPVPSGVPDSRLLPPGRTERTHPSWRVPIVAGSPAAGPAQPPYAMGEEPDPKRRPWVLAGLGAAALVLAFRLCQLALNPPGLPPKFR